jgi:GAF domain-containing protein
VPAAHPLVHGFLGAPILVAGAPAGSIYFANSEQGAFDEVDERTAVAAAAQAASILLRGAGSHDD